MLERLESGGTCQVSPRYGGQRSQVAPAVVGAAGLLHGAPLGLCGARRLGALRVELHVRARQ